MIAVAVLQCDWVLNHGDIEQAFVEIAIDRDISMKLPDGCDEFSGKVV